MATQAISTLTEVLLSSLAAIADQGHRPALDGYLDRHAPARLVQAVLDDDELLRRAAYASYEHANGFDKLILASSPAGHSIKLDVWWEHLLPVKDLGTELEQLMPLAIANALASDLAHDASPALLRTLAYITQFAPTFSLRGGTREVLRGLIARGLGLR